MKEELLAAVREKEDWKKRFNRMEYFQAFKEYTARFAPVYLGAVRGTEEAEKKALANEMLDALEAAWKEERIWNRASAKYDDKQMLIGYLSPMLLGLEDPDCCRFAEILQQSWSERWPKDGYQIAPYKVIRKGFRNVILGLEFRDNLRELEEELEDSARGEK